MENSKGSDNGDKTKDTVTLIVREMDRDPPARIADLPESERHDELKRIVMKYTKTDDEKERERFYEFTRLNYYPTACTHNLYDQKLDDILLESFCVALQTNSAEDIVNMIPADASIDGVYKFKIMNRASCRMLSREIQNFNNWCKENGSRTDPPSMYEHAVVLNCFGLRTIIDNLVKYLEPVVKAYFGCDGEIESQFSFSVTFGLKDGEHRSIDPNYGDDSDITIKLCLSDMDSRGAQLVLGERRCAVHETLQEEPLPKEMGVEMGEVVLHCGSHRNGFTPVEEYTKEYLIIWCKSPVFALMSRLKRPKWCIICERLRQENLKLIESQVVNLISSGDRGSPSEESPAKKPKL